MYDDEYVYGNCLKIGKKNIKKKKRNLKMIKSNKFLKKNIKSREKISLNKNMCPCGEGKDFGLMIECEKCKQWFHFNCAGVNEVRNKKEKYNENHEIHFNCKNCKTEIPQIPQENSKYEKNMKLNLLDSCKTIESKRNLPDQHQLMTRKNQPSLISKFCLDGIYQSDWMKCLGNSCCNEGLIAIKNQEGEVFLIPRNSASNWDYNNKEEGLIQLHDCNRNFYSKVSALFPDLDG